MTAVAIGEPVTGGALRAAHFFNGRLLTGEDLGREQDVQAARLRRFGQALGDGVVEGLTVSVTVGSSAATPTVSVRPGLAITRSGLALELAAETDVSLAGKGPGPGTEPGALFAQCQPYQPSEYSTGAGVYLLSIGPAATREGLAPVSGLHNEEHPCNTAYDVEGVSFRRLRLALPLAELDDRDRLRNRVAYRMFAPGEVAGLSRDPFGPPLGEYGLLDDLRPDCLGDDEVPLALVGWEAGAGIAFIDHWSVRRRVTRRSAPGRFGQHASDRLLAEGEARFLQFQDEVVDLRRAGSPGAVKAADRFDTLPAAGILPVGAGAPPGFSRDVFFSGVSVRASVFIEGPELESLLRASYVFPPIDVTTKELIWLYAVRANEVSEGGAGRCLVFAHGQMPYLGDARFELSYFNQANYALTA